MTERSFVRERTFTRGVPKIVHQTYSVRPEHPSFPTELRKSIKTLKADNPNWTFRFYDDRDIEEYVAAHFPELVGFYEKIEPKYGAARADFFRYLVVYREGGVYLDIKSGAARALDDIIKEDDSFILSHWPRNWETGKHPGIPDPRGELQQWYIAAAAGHPFLRSVINNVCNNISGYNPVVHDYGLWGVLNLTGPIAYTKAIYPLLNKYPHRLEEDHIATGFIYCAIGPRDYAGHRQGLYHKKVFEKEHYSNLRSSIVKIPLHKQVAFSASKPLIHVLRGLHRQRQKAD